MNAKIKNSNNTFEEIDLPIKHKTIIVKLEITKIKKHESVIDLEDTLEDFEPI